MGRSDRFLKELKEQAGCSGNNGLYVISLNEGKLGTGSEPSRKNEGE